MKWEFRDRHTGSEFYFYSDETAIEAGRTLGQSDDRMVCFILNPGEGINICIGDTDYQMPACSMLLLPGNLNIGFYGASDLVATGDRVSFPDWPRFLAYCPVRFRKRQASQALRPMQGRFRSQRRLSGKNGTDDCRPADHSAGAKARAT